MKNKKVSLSVLTFIGFALGIIFGIIFGDRITVIAPIGKLFLNLIKMVVVPMIFFSITAGISSLGDMTKLKKIGGKVIMIYIATSFLAACVGMLVANIVNPGIGFDLTSIAGDATYEATQLPSWADTILSMIPTNPFTALSNGNMMQIIVFSVFFGIGITMLGEKGKVLANVMETGAEAMYKVTNIVMQLAPIGVFALMANSIGVYGVKIFGPLAKLVLTDYIGLALMFILIYIPELLLIAKFPLGKFLNKMPKVWLMTASTTSSSGTLPVTRDVVENDLGVEEEVAGFTLPVGATINMDGACIYYAALVVFVSQIYNVDLSLTQMFVTILMTTLISVGSPGIPGGGIVMGVMLLTNMGLPVEVVGMIAGMYRLIDIGHTTLNVTGDVVQTLVISKTENMFKKVDTEIA